MINNKCVIKSLTGVLASVGMVAILAGCNIGSSEIDPFDYVELGQYKGLSVPLQVHEVTDEEIQDEFNTLAAGYAEKETLTEGTVESGDTANIDYVGTLNGVAFNGGTASGYDLTIGSQAFIAGFEDGLIGVNAGETVDLPLRFPDDYFSSDLAGQDVIFKVTVNYITRTKLPEITDDFINEISGGQYDNVDAYTEALKQQIISEYEEMNELQYYEDLWNTAVDNATLIKDIPDEMVKENTSRIVLNAQEYAKSYGMSFGDFVEQHMGVARDQFTEQAVEFAKKAAKESLVLNAIAKKENITVSEEEIKKAIDEYIELGTYASEEEFRSLNDMKALEEYILTSKVEEFLAENAVK